AVSTGGLARERLGRMYDVMAGHVERGDVPGLVTLLSRHGHIHVDAIGKKGVGGSDPIRGAPIFRTTSTTQPITAAPTMVRGGGGGRSRWIGCCPSWPTERFSGGSTDRSRTQCPRTGRSPCATC